MYMAALGMGLSLLGASSNKKAAERSMKAQAAADTAARQATASSMIAQVSSQNSKVKELERAGEIMQMQGKADAVIRKEAYNETQSMAMVMGAVSGRVFGSGSMETIMDKSKSDYMWDQLWAKNSLEISEAALEQDKLNIYQAGATSLMLGQQELEVARLGSMAGQQNTAAAAQNAFNNTLIGGVQSYASNYGDTLFGKTPWKD